MDVDKLLATDEHFLLGVWLENAKNMSTNDQERRLYEYNARNQITLWGPDGNVCAVRRHLACVKVVCSENMEMSSDWTSCQGCVRKSSESRGIVWGINLVGETGYC